MRLPAFLLLLTVWASAATPKRPSHLHNRHSSNLVWQTRATTFTGVDTTKTGALIHWDMGDGSSQNINDPVKVYPDTALKTVRMISSDGWTGLTVLKVHNKSMRGRIPSIAEAVNLTDFRAYGNDLTGPLPALDTNTALVYFNVSGNSLTGLIPSLASNIALTTFAVNGNHLNSTIPSLVTNTALAVFNIGNNFYITGPIPSLAANAALTEFNCEYNRVDGPIPSLAANTALETLNVQVNWLDGSIPSLTTNTALKYLAVGYNSLTGYVGGLGTRALLIFNIYGYNALTETAINAILADLVVAQAGGNPVCDVILSGGGNEAPAGQGIKDAATLVAAGWTVATN